MGKGGTKRSVKKEICPGQKFSRQAPEGAKTLQSDVGGGGRVIRRVREESRGLWIYAIF